MSQKQDMVGRRGAQGWIGGLCKLNWVTLGLTSAVRNFERSQALVWCLLKTSLAVFMRAGFFVFFCFFSKRIWKKVRREEDGSAASGQVGKLPLKCQQRLTLTRACFFSLFFFFFFCLFLSPAVLKAPILSNLKKKIGKDPTFLLKSRSAGIWTVSLSTDRLSAAAAWAVNIPTDAHMLGRGQGVKTQSCRWKCETEAEVNDLLRLCWYVISMISFHTNQLSLLYCSAHSVSLTPCRSAHRPRSAPRTAPALWETSARMDGWMDGWMDGALCCPDMRG